MTWIKKLTPNINLLLVVLLIAGLVAGAVVLPAQPVYAYTSANWTIGQSSDDVLYRLATSSFDTVSAVNEAGANTDAFYQYGSGMRYTGINIPKDYVVTNAYISFRAFNSDSGASTATRFSASDEDDAATFSTSGDFDTRWTARTTARVDWDSPTLTAWTGAVWYDSPDLSTIIQELVSRAGWSSGNDIVIFWDDHEDRSTHGAQDHRRLAASYDTNPAYAPKLFITWGPV
ncbi:hypothetical protein LCGC14_3168960, partial [marine sediment metagenome]